VAHMHQQSKFTKVIEKVAGANDKVGAGIEE
jgi:hypothetical protein